MKDVSWLRKRQLGGAEAVGAKAANEIDIIPIEPAFDGCGPGATRWIGARDNTVEHIVIEFDRPQAISRLSYEVKERALERTQEVGAEISDDAGRSYRHFFVQDYAFSPRGAIYQGEEQRFHRVQVDISV
jgi:hypothetical protein